jgi:uncharacterized delta-60 repeat protein
MWFFSPKTARRNPAARSGRNTTRPRLEALEDRCLLNAGALDPTFGNGGLAVAPIRGNGLGNTAVVVQPDGKIVAGGGSGAPGYNEFALVRYNANGSLDTAFGNNGVVLTSVGSTTSYLEGLAIDGSGNIVAVGSSLVSPGEFAVARYLPNGVLDATFGSGGIVLTRVGSSQASAYAVAIQGSQIYVAGTASQGNSSKHSTPPYGFALARYNANGTLDNTFGPSHNGVVITPQFVPNQNDVAYAMAIQSDGKIVLAGAAGSKMAVVRYTPSGVLDTSFNGSGIVTGLAMGVFGNNSTNSVLVQSNGGIVVGGGSSTGATLARLTSSGQLDTTFGSQGYASNSNLATAYAVAQAADGDLLAAGSTGNGSTGTGLFGVAAFLPTGAPDTTFGTGGMTTANFSSAGQFADAVAIQADGKIVVDGVIGVSTNTPSLALARFLPPNTKVGSFTASPNPVTAGSNVTLSASNLTLADPSSAITQVAFYLDSNNDGSLEPGTDALLGYATQTSPGVWTFTFSTSAMGLTAGTYKLFAQAEDSDGVFSDPAALTLIVQ